MKNNIIKSVLILITLLSFSCEEYLDKAPETDLDQEDVFKDFDNTQGFVEEMYQMVVDYGTAGHTFQDFTFGDDGYVSIDWFASRNVDRGNMVFPEAFKFSYFYDGGNNVGSSEARNRPGLWTASLRGIRKANIVIANTNLMVNLSQEEKDVILGQAYFFRAFFHNEIMKFWGRFPYIKEVLTTNFKLPRPETYKACALEANEDYKRAIALLPQNWDAMSYGQKTLGQNRGRLTKAVAYAFQGKNLLFAASPLMHFNNQPGIDTYTYDTDLCNMAVDAFAEVLKLTDQGKFALVPFDSYEKVFWDNTSRNTWPGSTEFIFAAPAGSQLAAQRFMVVGTVVAFNGIAVSEPISPTHNFIHNNFGMANGLSIEDDISGVYGTPTYNPSKPFENRDPRFYKWLIIDGDVIATRATAPLRHRFAQLYEGGAHEIGINGFKGGYMQKKFYPTLHSRWNNILGRYLGMRLHMRLTDVYLMYAEALHAAKGANVAPASYPLTAQETINKLRARALTPDVNPDIVANNTKFMDEIRRERSVELSFEIHRWMDIRRWGVAHLDKYKKKTALVFPEDHSYFEVKELLTRVCDYPKHYWIPFEPKQTQIYEGFPQNPGW